MRVASTDIILGRTAAEMRNVMRALRKVEQLSEGLVEQLANKALGGEIETMFFGELVAAGYVERVPPRRPGDGKWWRITVQGNALAMAKFTKPVKRLAAQKAFDGFMERVRQANVDPAWLHSVQRVSLFGSFLDPDAVIVGDVDLSVELSSRIPEAEENVSYLRRVQRFADDRGHTSRTITEELSYPQIALFRFLRGGSRVLSIHQGENLDTLGGDYEVVFEAEPFEDGRPL